MTSHSPRQTPLLLPERSRLLHIGLPKTGTTHLQNAAAALREPLLEHGVHYPGRTFNHRREVSSFMGRGWGWGAKPTLDNWNRLMEEIEADTKNRIWLGHEFASESSAEMVAKFRESLGRNVHVVVTLRHYGSILASSWQQYMKMGDVVDYESWLQAVLADPPDRTVTHTFHTRNDQGLVVSRWAEEFGAENVTAIVIDKATPNLLTDAFEDLLGLPREFLATAEHDGFSSNRGMSVEEAELLRAVNAEFRSQKIAWPAYERWVRNGVAGHLMRSRKPGELDTPFELPRWAADKATERGNRYVDQIEASGARVVGDLSALRAPAPASEDPTFAVGTVPMEVGVQAVLGALEAGFKRDKKLAGVEKKLASLTGMSRDEVDDMRGELVRLRGQALENLTAKQLVGEVARRGAGRARRALRRR